MNCLNLKFQNATKTKLVDCNLLNYIYIYILSFGGF